MVETRRAARFKVLKLAKIGSGKDEIVCTIRDLSITGAAIEVEDQAVVPDSFALFVPEDGLNLTCRIVWRRGYRIGVVFDESQPSE